MTCIHLKKFKVFSSLRRSETQIRNAQWHQQASTSTGSINILQSTIFTVDEVYHQKTINAKLGTQTNSVSEVIKNFHHHFQKKNAGENKKLENKVALRS